MLGGYLISGLLNYTSTLRALRKPREGVAFAAWTRQILAEFSSRTLYTRNPNPLNPGPETLKPIPKALHPK